MKRREFLKTALGLAGAVTVAPLILGGSKALSQERRRGGAGATNGASDMVDPKESMASAIGYIEDYKKSPKAAGKKCATCVLYKKTGTKDGKETGSCTIFPKKLVYGDAYCNSWAKK